MYRSIIQRVYCLSTVQIKGLKLAIKILHGFNDQKYTHCEYHKLLNTVNRRLNASRITILTARFNYRISTIHTFTTDEPGS